MSADTGRQPLEPGDVHLWTVPLDVGGLADALPQLLSRDEEERARRFYRAVHARRFVVARGQLRRILASYLGAEPASLRFRYGQRGKPFLDGAQLEFNLAHSNELALVGVRSEKALGVDLEWVGREVEAEALARRFFAPAEYEELLALPLSQRHEAFFLGWTRKEAFVKAKGGGLAIPLSSFEVTLSPNRPVELVRVAKPGEAARWSLYSMAPAAGYVAAVCAERGVRRLVHGTAHAELRCERPGESPGGH